MLTLPRFFQTFTCAASRRRNDCASGSKTSWNRRRDGSNGWRRPSAPSPTRPSSRSKSPLPGTPRSGRRTSRRRPPTPQMAATLTISSVIIISLRRRSLYAAATSVNNNSSWSSSNSSNITLGRGWVWAHRWPPPRPRRPLQPPSTPALTSGASTTTLRQSR